MNKKVISFIAIIILLPVVTIYSAITGSIEISAFEMIKGLFSGADENVAIIQDLRFPRIIISLFAGAALSVSGVLLQAVMRNPLRSEERRVGKECRLWCWAALVDKDIKEVTYIVAV